MIKVPVNLVPFGILPAETLGELHISNDGTLKGKRGNYAVIVYGKNGNVLKTGVVKNWPRLTRPVFDLIIASLQAVGYKGRKS